MQFAYTFIKDMIGTAGVRGVSEDCRLKLQTIHSSLRSVPRTMTGFFNLHKVECKVPVTAPELGMVPTAVYENLNSYLLQKYTRELNGIMLAYSDFELPDTAKLMWDLPHLIVPITLNALVFSPLPAVHLVGKVVKQAWDHVAVLVLGVFNATIPNAELTGAGKDIPAVGSSVNFYLSKLDVSSTPLIIRGSLTRANGDEIEVIDNPTKKNDVRERREPFNKRNGDRMGSGKFGKRKVPSAAAAVAAHPQNTHKTFGDDDADEAETNTKAVNTHKTFDSDNDDQNENNNEESGKEEEKKEMEDEIVAPKKKKSKVDKKAKKTEEEKEEEEEEKEKEDSGEKKKKEKKVKKEKRHHKKHKEEEEDDDDN